MAAILAAFFIESDKMKSVLSWVVVYIFIIRN
jgi:hypothetical protein